MEPSTLVAPPHGPPVFEGEENGVLVMCVLPACCSSRAGGRTRPSRSAASLTGLAAPLQRELASAAAVGGGSAAIVGSAATIHCRLRQPPRWRSCASSSSAQGAHAEDKAHARSCPHSSLAAPASQFSLPEERSCSSSATCVHDGAALGGVRPSAALLR